MIKFHIPVLWVIFILWSAAGAKALQVLPEITKSTIGTPTNEPTTSPTDLEITKIQKQLLMVTNRLQHLENENIKLKNDNIRLKANVNAELVKIKSQLNNMSLVALKENGFISFAARPTETKVYNEGELVEFPGIITNYGGHYDPSTSTFTCPYTGFYMFFVSVFKDYNQSSDRMVATIALEGTTLSTAYSRNDAGASYDSASNMIVTLCQMGQRVWIKSNFDDSALYQGFASTFQGTLLRVG